VVDPDSVAAAAAVICHYTGQTASVGIPSQELEDFIGAKFFCLHAVAEGT